MAYHERKMYVPLGHFHHELVSASALRRMGWSWQLMTQLLGEPDEIGRHPVQTHVKVRLWEWAKVNKAEATPEHAAYFAGRAKRLAGSKRTPSDYSRDMGRPSKHALLEGESYADYRKRVNRVSAAAGQRRRRAAAAKVRQEKRVLDRSIWLYVVEVHTALAVLQLLDKGSVKKRMRNAHVHWRVAFRALDTALVNATRRKRNDPLAVPYWEKARPKPIEIAPAKTLLPILMPMVYLGLKSYFAELSAVGMHDEKVRRMAERRLFPRAKQARGWKGWPTGQPAEPEWARFGIAAGTIFRANTVGDGHVEPDVLRDYDLLHSPC